MRAKETQLSAILWSGGGGGGGGGDFTVAIRSLIYACE